MQGEALAFGESSMGGTLLVGLRPPRRVPPIEESPRQWASPFTILFSTVYCNKFLQHLFLPYLMSCSPFWPVLSCSRLEMALSKIILAGT
jgi:hypothetical protein